MRRNSQNLDTNWLFSRSDSPVRWEQVYLPHSPFISDLDGQDHWHGICEYKRPIQLDAVVDDARYKLYFGAAMHSARVLVDGDLMGVHTGGYLPFEVDVTASLSDGLEHELRVVLDNRDNEEVPPGKPLGELDFCYYGGLYRQVELRTISGLHVSDPVAADTLASGGVFVRTLAASKLSASLAVGVHVCNESVEDAEFQIAYRIYDPSSLVVAEGRLENLSAEAGAARSAELEVSLERPRLWSIAEPQLHTVEIDVVVDGVVCDQVREKFGVRRVTVSRSGGLTLNGERIRPRGVNRHQDYPRIGYALSDAAQYRDAKRIKESGFDYVRLSHYPQSPAFLDACDELGILVMNCIPGWQYLGGDSFREACYRNARELIRRDRNHPCIVFWELSLNETAMDDEFMDTLQAIGHEEYPGDQMFVCGWQDHFDVYIHSRQHGQIHNWKNGDKALVIAEYGDWEFYASNEGFDQKTGSGLLAESSNSRAFRGAGEQRLRQQARNHIVALDDTLSSPAVTDGLWSMFDYPRGYHPTRAACGVMDVHRLPKYSYFFYRSQRGPLEGGSNWEGGPMVYIASRWVEDSILDVLVFSNCEQVSLSLNGVNLGVQTASENSSNKHLPSPPFVFSIDAFEPGCLEASGVIGGDVVATHSVSTPEKPESIALTVDDCGVPGPLGRADVLFVHARVLDASGYLCKLSSPVLSFRVSAPAEIVGPVEVGAESGIASVVVRRPAGLKSFQVEASCSSLGSQSLRYEVCSEAALKSEEVSA